MIGVLLQAINKNKKTLFGNHIYILMGVVSMRKTKYIILLIVPFAILGCRGGSGYYTSGGCKSLSYAFGIETTTFGSKKVVYAVFYEGHPIDRFYSSAKGVLTLTMPNSTVVKLPYSKGGQYWVDKDGKVTTISKAFTPQDLMKIKELCEQPDVDLKSINDINQLLKKPEPLNSSDTTVAVPLNSSVRPDSTEFNRIHEVLC